MTALVGLMDGLGSIQRSVAAQSRESGAGAVTAVVSFDSVVMNFDVDVDDAHAENFNVHLEAVDDTVEKAHSRMAEVLVEISALWWSEAGRTLNGAARMSNWSQAADFGLSADSHEGRHVVMADVSVSAIVANARSE